MEKILTKQVQKVTRGSFARIKPTMTDPTLIQPTSSSGSGPPTSPSRDSQSPPTYPSISTSTSGTGSVASNTAPSSPERVQMTALPARMTGAAPPAPAAPLQPNLKPASSTRAAPQMDSVVLGLQQLERQQAAERAQKSQAAQVFRVPHDPEDDDTVPSSTQNSNTNEDPLNDQGGSSIGRFITNTRVRNMIFNEILALVLIIMLTTRIFSIHRNDFRLEI